MIQPGADTLKGRGDHVNQNQAAPGGGGHYAAVPQNPHFSQQAYHQSHGYGHTYHPPPQYNSAPPPPPPQAYHFGFGNGIHYTYLLLMALAFATVVQITKGGLFALDGFQRPQFVYPTVSTSNLRVPSNNYYVANSGGMMNGGMMNGGMMNNNPNMMNPNMMNPNMMNPNMMNQNNMMMNNNPNMMMNNNPNMMMMNGANMQQVQQQSPPGTVTAVAQSANTDSNVVTPVADPVAPTSTVEATASVATESVQQVDSEISIPDEEPLPELVITKDVDTTSTTTSSKNAEAIESIKLSELDNFKNTWDEWEPSDTPVFFHIPKAGGSTIKDIIGTCHRFIAATEAGITDGHADDEEIAIVYPGGGPAGQDRTPFVNVDTTTVAGIARAKAMGFADSGLADVVVTPFIYEANELFTPSAKGRLFTVFRHPIDRAISLFYYLQVADWEPTFDPELKNWSIKEYAQSSRIENNWLTRQLSGQLGGELHDEDLQLAMEVVRSKFLVGLMTEIEATMSRCEKFFRWTFHVNPPNQEKCRDALLHGGSNSNSANKKEKPKEGSEDWELLAWQNQFDLQLYEYIESLFEEQEAFVSDIPDDFRMIDSTCCKCDPATFPPEGFECPKAIPF